MFHTFGWNQVCEQCFASSISCHQHRHLMASDCVSRELSWGSKEPIVAIVDANDRDLFSVIGPNHPTMRIAFASASHTVRTPGSEGDVTHRMSLHLFKAGQTGRSDRFRCPPFFCLNQLRCLQHALSDLFGIQLLLLAFSGGHLSSGLLGARTETALYPSYSGAGAETALRPLCFRSYRLPWPCPTKGSVGAIFALSSHSGRTYTPFLWKMR